MSGSGVVTSADGTEIAYRQIGTGPPVVLVHGSATTGGDWAFALRHLRKSFAVTIMDRRGRGRSGDGPEYAIEREAEDILALLEEVDAELLVGHSYGALCSILASARTERLKRLVVYEPPVSVGPEVGDRLAELIADGLDERALTSFLKGSGASETELEGIRTSPAWPVLVGTARTLPREMRAAAAWRWPADPISVPTLFLIGGETTGPAYLAALAGLTERFAQVRKESIEGQRHIAHIAAARRFSEIVSEFLA